MSLPLLRPLLLTVGATSLVFFGGVIALAVQSPESANPSLNTTLSALNLVTQNADLTSDSASFKAVANPSTVLASAKQSSFAALTPAQAAALAKQETPTARLQATPELINYNGTVAYEVLLDSGATYIDANLGVVLNPATTDNYRVEGFDDDYEDDDYKSEKGDDDHHDDDDKYKSKKHNQKKHHDDEYKDNGRLIATSYQQHGDDNYDDDKESYDD